MTLGHESDLGDTDPAAMEANCRAVLDAAWAVGVRYFDAARSYGRSEEFLAGWLRARDRQRADVTVASKWGYTYTAGWKTRAAQHEVKDHSLAALDRQAAESLGWLGPWLSVYQIHSVTPDSPVLADAGVLDALRRLRDGGDPGLHGPRDRGDPGPRRLRLGLTVSGPLQAELIRRALALRDGDRPLFEVVQATWNLLEPSAGPALAEAHDAGLTVVLKEGMSNGRLARQPPPALLEVARSLRAAPDAVALASALSQPWADVVLSGAATVPQIDSNATASLLRIDDGARRALAGLAEDPQHYWSARSKLEWT